VVQVVLTEDQKLVATLGDLKLFPLDAGERFERGAGPFTRRPE
jgi:hypothetical protein